MGRAVTVKDVPKACRGSLKESKELIVAYFKMKNAFFSHQAT
jgi:hypothetical protein